MNRNSLSRHYNVLRGQERMVLILAAQSRGDKKEVRRLMQSAPRMRIQVLDCYGRVHALSQAIRRITQLQLESAGSLLVMLPCLNDHTRSDMLYAFYLHLYNYLLVGETWRRFCTDLQIGPDIVKRILKISTPLTDLTDDVLGDMSLAKVSAILGELAEKGAKLPTVEQIAKEMKDQYEKEASEWEPQG